MVFTYAVPVDMGYLDEEEQGYLEDVAAVKKWWEDSRWKYTKRPFTAEQIVQKRGNLKIEYPSNVQAKKLWKIIEGRFAVCYILSCYEIPLK
jgi:isocitrate lyase